MLIGNKSDLKKDAKVTEEDIANFTKRTGIPVLKTSAKLGANIESAFVDIAKKLIVLKSDKAKKEAHAGVKISDGENKSVTGCCGQL